MRALVRTRILILNTDSAVTDDVVDSAINSALAQAALEQDWPWLQATTTITTAANTVGYDMPEDWLRTISVSSADDSKAGLRLRSINDIDQYNYTGLPSGYAIFEEQIHLGPTPSGVATYTHRYIRQEAVLEEDEDEPFIPTYWQKGVIEYAAFLIFQMLHKNEEAAGARQAYLDWLIRSRDNIKQSTGSVQVKVRPGSYF